MSLDDFMARLLWEPDYDSCVTCSTMGSEVPARYEAWLELVGPAWFSDGDPPETVRHAHCVGCAAEMRAEDLGEGEYAMRLVLVRSLR